MNQELFRQSDKEFRIQKPHAKYCNIIFDVGGVLLDFDPEKFIATIFKDRPEAPSILREAIYTQEWLEMDRGVLTPTQVSQALADRFVQDDLYKFMEHIPSFLKPLPAGIDLLRAVQAQGYRTYVLSNMSDWCYKEIYFKNSFFKTFDGAIFSFQVKLVKPELEIYRHLLKTYNLKADECLFIDDLEVNINAGKSLGIDGIVCDDHAQVHAQLKQLAVLD